MKRDIDSILKQALAPEDEPDARLNRRILNQAEEMTRMARMRKSRIPAAILAASITLVIGSTAVFAAWKYLSPAQMAEKFEDGGLAEAFQDEDAILVNETQEYGGYKVTLLGAVSGETACRFLSSGQRGQLEENRLYAALAIEHADGTPMPDTSDNAYGEESFFASPYIKGLDPVWYNAITLGGGYGEFVENGVQYRMLEVDNVEMFADRGIYIGVNEGSFPDNTAYTFDEASGEITRNESYDGLNALFVLPLDPARADPAAAQEIIDHIWDDDDDKEPLEMTAEDMEIEDFIAKLTGENIEEYAEVIESTVQICKVDENGEFHFKWEVESGASSEGVGWIDDSFPDKRPGTRSLGGYCSDGTVEGLYIDCYTLNEDGTVTVAVYRPKTN